MSKNAPLDFALQDNFTISSIWTEKAVVWGGWPNADLILFLEVLHRRAARIICNLPRDIPTDEVYQYSNWNTLTFCSKHRLLKLLNSVFMGEAPAALSY